MTLCQLMFEYFVDVGCGGNKNMVAKALGISRRRVNSISNDLDNGAGLASTMTRLLCEYRRRGMNINGVVDLFLRMEDTEQSSGCAGIKMIEEVWEKWTTEQGTLIMINAEIYIRLKWIAENVGGLYCCERCGSSECDERCPCWCLAGLMATIHSQNAASEPAE